MELYDGLVDGGMSLGESLHDRSAASAPAADFFSSSISPHSQSGYASSSIASTVGLAFRYAMPNNGAPPGIEPASFVGLGKSLPGWAFAVDVERSVGVEIGCEIPGVEDETAGGGALGLLLEGGGCDGAAPRVVGTVATEREKEEDGGGGLLRVNGRRNRMLRRQEVHSMAATAKERTRVEDDSGWCYSYQGLY